MKREKTQFCDSVFLGEEVNLFCVSFLSITSSTSRIKASKLFLLLQQQNQSISE